MARAFSIHTVLRMTTNGLLREFFRQTGQGDLGIAWDELRERDIQSIVTALHQLPRACLDRVEAALHNVFDLACDTGITAYIEAAGCCGVGRPAAELPVEGGVYDKAMWAFLRHPQAFERATLIHQIDRLSWWRKRNDLPAKQPKTSTDAKQELAQELSRLLLQGQGRGLRCTVDSLVRGDTDYFFAHPDDYAHNATAHDEDGVLAPRTFRQTFLIVFAYDRQAGTLELFAKGSGEFKASLEQVFARTILCHQLGPWDRKAAYSLNGLKSPHFSLTTDPEDGVTAHVKRLRLSFPNSHRRITLEADPGRGPDDIYRMLDEILDKHHVPCTP